MFGTRLPKYTDTHTHTHNDKRTSLESNHIPYLLHKSRKRYDDRSNRNDDPRHHHHHRPPPPQRFEDQGPAKPNINVVLRSLPDKATEQDVSEKR